MEYEIFSKRQQRIRGGAPDTYQHESIPKELRFQVLYIWEKVWEKADYNDYFGVFQLSELATDVYNSIEMTLREEYGVRSLIEGSDPDEEDYSTYQAVHDFFFETEDTDKVIDVIELSFRYIDQVIRDKFHVYEEPDEAIDQLNRRFLEHSVSYQYESGLIVKVDSQDIHSEVVKPTEELPNNTQQAVNNDIMNNGTNDENKKIFIGHGRSLVWRVLKDFIVEELELPYEEFERISTAGKSISNRLEEMLEESCMAFIIMTGEDEHADNLLHARENVIHEVGLFQGRLGFEKAIVLLEDGCERFSNIEGLIHISFPMGNIEAAFERIRKVLKRESII